MEKKIRLENTEALSDEQRSQMKKDLFDYFTALLKEAGLEDEDDV